MEGPSRDVVLYEERDGVGWITLNRPEKLNALNRDVFNALLARLTALDASERATVGVLHGAGRAFAAGADIEDYIDLSVDQYRAFMDVGRQPTDLIGRLTKPVIAAVQGFALGGGFELVLACDLVVAANNARFGLPEPKLGLVPGGGGTQRLPRLVGRTRALEILLTGRFLTAEEAYQWGIVNQVVAKDDLLPAAAHMAGTMTALAPQALAVAKRVVRDGLESSLPAALTLEQDATARLIATDDAREGITAFVEKRDAKFPSRRSSGRTSDK
jgi:enoyl-CoA hydratase/carnithine racemase